MQWNRSYSIGVEKIDNQHKRLMQFATTLENAIQDGSASENMGRILKSLVDYTCYHFKDEEDLMIQINFSEYDQHKELHMALIDDVRKILLDIRRGRSLSAADLMLFLKKWITDHIEKEDKKIGIVMEKIRAEFNDPSGKADKLVKTPTHEVGINLEKLRYLVSEALITKDDLETKKKDLLDKFTESFSPNSFVEVIEEFNSVSILAEKGLINNEDKHRIEQEWSNRLDLSKIISDDDSLEDSLQQLKSLLEKKIISNESYDKSKTDILKRI